MAVSQSNEVSSPGERDAHGVWLRDAWAANRRWVAAILLAHKPRWADLDDLLQDVAFAVVRKGHEIRDPAAFRPWLRTVATNVAHAAARSGKLREGRAGNVSVDGGDDVMGRIGFDPQDTPVERVAFDEEGRRVMEMAMSLPDGYREPLLLKAVQGMSYREIGEVLDLPESTIETRIARARRMLREKTLAAEEA